MPVRTGLGLLLHMNAIVFLSCCSRFFWLLAIVLSGACIRVPIHPIHSALNYTKLVSGPLVCSSILEAVLVHEYLGGYPVELGSELGL